MVCAAQLMRNANNWTTPSNSDRNDIVLDKPINLSEMENSINKKWKWHSTRYYMDNIINDLPNNNNLKKHLINLLP
jgi:hypothetical protein